MQIEALHEQVIEQVVNGQMDDHAENAQRHGEFECAGLAIARQTDGPPGCQQPQQEVGQQTRESSLGPDVEIDIVLSLIHI